VKAGGYYTEALQRFQRLLAQAKRTGRAEPTAVVLATADRRGQCSIRMVLLRGMSERGLVFFTNMHSSKAKQLLVNPRAAMCFALEPLHQQVLIEGWVKRISNDDADAYWATRPRQSQLAAWASKQSQPLPHRSILLARMAHYHRLFARRRQVPRPTSWSGFRLIPDRIEFWRRRPFRLHERRLYEKHRGGWTTSLLYP
jgi:pyridoxamine 5'-phosphate oxidase